MFNPCQKFVSKYRASGGGEKCCHQSSGGQRREVYSDLAKSLYLNTGLAGAGKSAVIKAVKGYAARYTATWGFLSPNTPSASRHSPVQLRQIGAETLHSAAHLMNNKVITVTRIELWKDTRMLVIDEVSFAKYCDLKKLDKNLRRVTECYHLPLRIWERSSQWHHVPFANTCFGFAFHEREHKPKK
jgi:hypothetical protein